MKTLGTFLAVTLLCAGAQAADQNVHFQVLDAGTIPCRQYLDGSKEDRRYQDSWISGYLTAINRTTHDTWSILGKESKAQIDGRIVKKCSEHPDAMLAVVVHAVTEELYKTRIREKPNE